MAKPSFSVIIPARNAGNFIDYCLLSLLNQDYKNFEIIFFDNNSTDATLKKAKLYQQRFKKRGINFKIINSPFNYFVGGAFNRAYLKARGNYIMLLCIDVILKNDFLSQALIYFKKKPKIGALQAKIYAFDINELTKSRAFLKTPTSQIIDTCGFKIFRSRRIINIGHGMLNGSQFSKAMEIFGVEGACPVFRRQALEDIKIKIGERPEIFDEDMMWYGDDLDVAWRLNLFGWRQIFCPTMIAYHDRKTTKLLSQGFLDFIKIRRNIPTLKRILDYRNTRLTFIKNEHWFYFKKDFLPFLKRELSLLIYFFIFEPKTFWFGVFGLLKRLSLFLNKRKLIQRKVKSSNIRYIYSHLIKD